MSSDDTIKVEVDDTEVDMLIAKLKQAMTLEGTITKKAGTSDARKLMNEWRALERLWAGMVADPETKSLYERLPSINREMRILIGLLPGGYEAQRQYFNLKRLARGFAEGDVALYLSVITTAILILRQVMEIQKRIERRQQEQEMYIRREKGLSHDEYVKWKSDADAYFRSKPG